MAFSSKNGNVKYGAGPTDIIDVIDWNCEHTNDVQAYASSDTSGGRLRVSGIEDFTATLQCLQDATTQVTDALTIGASVALKLYENATLLWDVAAVMVESIGVATPIGTGGMVTYTVRVGRNGAVTVPT